MEFVNFILVCSLLVQPTVDSPETVIGRLESDGVEIQGRDPYYGSGLCGALLPVHGPKDVYFVTFAEGNFTAQSIYRLRHFPNLLHVRFPRNSAKRLREQLREGVPEDVTLIPCNSE